MTPDKLRALADEATPGPWMNWQPPSPWVSRAETNAPIAEMNSHETAQWYPDARLIALAPDLARLCAEQHEVLRRIAEGDRPSDSPTWHSGKSWRIELAKAALAKLSELEAR